MTSCPLVCVCDTRRYLGRVCLLAPHPPSVAEVLFFCLCFPSTSPALSAAPLLPAFQRLGHQWWHSVGEGDRGAVGGPGPHDPIHLSSCASQPQWQTGQHLRSGLVNEQFSLRFTSWIGGERQGKKTKHLEKAHVGRWPLGCPYHLCGYGIASLPGTWAPGVLCWVFFIRIKKKSYFSLPPKTFYFTGNMKTEGGRAAFPCREYCAAESPQQCLLLNETQQQRRGEESAVKRRCTVRDPKIGEIIILSMMIKNWIPAKAQLYCIMLILGNKRQGWTKLPNLI